ncbi:hypothetical protein ABK040_011338 [Willaertia magna]
MSIIWKPLLFISKILQKAEIGQKSYLHDAKYTIPFFFTLGIGMEIFMIKTGFYEYRKRKESEKLTAQAAEYLLAKDRIIERFAEKYIKERGL